MWPCRRLKSKRQGSSFVVFFIILDLNTMHPERHCQREGSKLRSSNHTAQVLTRACKPRLSQTKATLEAWTCVPSPVLPPGPSSSASRIWCLFWTHCLRSLSTFQSVLQTGDRNNFEKRVCLKISRAPNCLQTRIKSFPCWAWKGAPLCCAPGDPA